MAEAATPTSQPASELSPRILQQIVSAIRRTSYGRVIVEIKAGRPVHVETQQRELLDEAPGGTRRT